MREPSSTLPYARLVHRIQHPCEIAALACATGRKVPDPSKPFTYADFGCGFGLTAILLAKAMPHGDFYGIDYLSEHIVSARKTAEELGVNNITFIEGDFSNLSQAGLPPLDFAVAHGILSWIADDVQERLLSAMSNHLKPGGLCFVSYNMPSGWGEKPAVRQYMQDVVDHGIPLKEAILEGGRALDQVSGTGAAKNAGWPSGQNISDDDFGYLYGEYMVDTWRLTNTRQISNALSDVGLEFVGPLHSDIHLLDASERPLMIEDLIFWEDRHNLMEKLPFRSAIFSKPLEKTTEPANLTHAPEFYISLMPGQITLDIGNGLIVSAMGGARSPYPCVRFSAVLDGLDDREKQALGESLRHNAAHFFMKSVVPDPNVEVGKFQINKTLLGQLKIFKHTSGTNAYFVSPNAEGIVLVPNEVTQILECCDGIPEVSYPAALSHCTTPEGGVEYSKLMYYWKKYWAPWALAHGIIEKA